MKRYPHIFLSVALVLAVASCQRGELDYEQPSAKDQFISYATSVEPTRANKVDDQGLEDYGRFSVATFLDDDDNSHYYSDVVSFDGSQWAGDQNRYWPVNNKVDMYAYSPLADFIVVENPTQHSSYALQYTCPSDVDSQVDLLAQKLVNQSPSTGAGYVRFDLKHILSGIKFNVEIESESNVTLDSITINYVSIENQRTYDFASESWGEPAQGYFDMQDGLSTSIKVNKTATSYSGSLVFNDIDNHLMIIPQQISHSESDPHYLSIQVAYTLNGAQDNVKIPIVTGVMPLPTPSGASAYEQGKTYVYNLSVNGKVIVFSDLSIEDQDTPTPANGNIDLGLITDPSSIDGYTGSDISYTTALRVRDLLLDGVRDFVVVGSMGADQTNHLGNGKLGFYGKDTSPFSIGAALAKAQTGQDYYYSVDLRKTYEYPEFQYANSDGGTTTTPSGGDIDKTDPIMIAGLFSEVKGLKEVMLPSGIMAIGNHAFEDCDALTSIDIAQVKHIEVGAFQHSSSLKTVLNGELTRIHNNGFDSCTSLTTIDLSRVTEIDDFGFIKCSSLTNVNLSQLSVIGKNAFDGCSSLTLDPLAAVPVFTSVADYAFSGCSQLGKNDKRIDLATATYVGDHAFNECTEIKLSDGNLSEMIEINNYAFAHCKHIGEMFEVLLPKIDRIGNSAFEDCPKLNIVQGLERLTEISAMAFKDCVSLTGYSADATDKTLYLSKVARVGGYGFFNTALTSVDFGGENLSSIGDYAFLGCEDLTSLAGLDKVSEVGNYAFSGCSALTQLELPSLTSENCGGNFISGCTSLERVSLPLIAKDGISWAEEDENGNVTNPYTTITSMLLGSKSTLEYLDLRSMQDEFPGWSFNDSKLVEVNIASVASVGNGAFQNSASLQKIDLSSATKVGHYAFQNCTALEELVLPMLTDEGCGGDFFQYCTSLKVLSLPLIADNDLSWTDGDGLHESTIMGMLSGSLEQVYLPRLVVEVLGWGGVLQNNTNLRVLELSAATSVGSGGLSGCTALEVVDLSSATKIGAQAFDGSVALRKLNLAGIIDNPDSDNDGTPDNIDASAFWNIDTAECEIWLSDEQAATASNGMWLGLPWKAIHSASSGEPFTLD